MKIHPMMLPAALIAAVGLSACSEPEPAGDDPAFVQPQASVPAGEEELTQADAAPMTDHQHHDEHPESSAPLGAVAQLMPTEGNTARGTVSFMAVEGGVRVRADISGLTPGLRGFHVHEHGDCSAPDASSAGGHFNPHGKDHGSPGADQHHIGDLGNIEADQNGRGLMSEVFPFLSLSGEHSIIGRAVVVHAETDDLETQPTGAAGARVACGIIHGGG